MEEFSFQVYHSELADGSLASVIVIRGNIDSPSAKKLESYLSLFLQQQLEDGLSPSLQNASRNILLDFSRVTYINSSGLGVLVNFCDSIHKIGGNVVIFGIPEKLKILFDMLGLNVFFRIGNTLEEAKSILHKFPPPPAVGAPPRKRLQEADTIDAPFDLGDASILDELKKKPKPPSPTTTPPPAGPAPKLDELKAGLGDEPKRAITPLKDDRIERQPETLAKEVRKEKEEIAITTTKKVEAPQVQNFEKWLDEDAGAPGAFERTIAQSVLLMKALQKTIGLYFVIIANAIDAVLSAITGYINGIFQAWKLYRTVQRRLQRKDPAVLVQNIATDLNTGRIQLSRLFSFSGFQLAEHTTQVNTKATTPSFALQLVIEIRGHLDQMKRDLAVVNIRQAQKSATKTIKSFFTSFIPNPIEWLTPLKDLFILAFLMHYSRREIEQMYLDLVLSYQHILNLLHKDCPNTTSTWQWWNYEATLLQKNGNSYTPINANDLDKCIEECRHKVQRLIQMLCNPAQFIYPQKWSRFDLLAEVMYIEKCGKGNPIFQLQLEKWLSQQVAKTLNKKGFRIDAQEKQLRLQEKAQWLSDLRQQQQHYQQFI